MITKVDYELAIASGTLDLIRGDEINRLVREKYREPGSEYRILADMIADPSNPEHIAAFNEHEAYVDECKAKVDAEMQQLRAELEAAQA